MCYEVTHEKNMQNLKIKRDCGRARNAQGSPKAGARAIFAQKNLAQPQYVARSKPGFVFHIGGWSSIHSVFLKPILNIPMAWYGWPYHMSPMQLDLTSRARASRVTEVSREGRTCEDKGEPIGTMPDPPAGAAVDCVISWKSVPLASLALDIFVWCCHCLLIWLAPDILHLHRPSGCLLLVWTSFSPWHFSFNFLFRWLHFLLIFPTLFTLLLSSLLFSSLFLLSSVPTFFTSRLSSTIYSSSPLYRLHISTVLTPILSSHLYFFHTSTFFTSLLSSHLYILHISAVFTSLLSSHLYCLHFSIVFSPRLSSRLCFLLIFILTLFICFKSLMSCSVFTSRFSSFLYFLHFPTLFTSLLS